MSIKQKINGKVSLVPIHATEVSMVDPNNNFTKKNVEGALQELKADKVKVVYSYGNTSENIDLDDLIIIGTYRLVGSNCLNIPNDLPGPMAQHSIVNVYKGEQVIVQELTTTNNTAYIEKSNITYKRVKSFSNWSEWKQLATLEELPNPNILINGDFQVWQRGISFANVTNHYTADRWLFGGNTGAKLEKTNNGTKITLLNDGGWANYLQSIEHDTFKKLIGKTVTVTFKLSEKTNKVSQLWSLEYTNPRHYYMNKDFNDGVMRDTFTMTFEIGENTENAEIGIQLFANKGNSITIKYVKLEIGSVSTPFTPRPYAEELALCQRYYLSTDGYENNWMHGCYVQGGGFRVFIPSLSKFRITPTTIQNKLGQTEFFGDDAKWHKLKYVQSYPLDGGGVEVVYTLENPNGMVTIGNSYIIRNLPSLNAEL